MITQTKESPLSIKCTHCGERIKESRVMLFSFRLEKETAIVRCDHCQHYTSYNPEELRRVPLEDGEEVEVC